MDNIWWLHFIPQEAFPAFMTESKYQQVIKNEMTYQCLKTANAAASTTKQYWQVYTVTQSI